MPKKRSVKKSRGRHRRRKQAVETNQSREIVGIFGLGCAIFLMAALVSRQIGDGGLMGPFGSTIAGGVYVVMGVVAYLFATVVGFLSVRLLLGKEPVADGRHLLGGAVIGLSLTLFLHIAIGGNLSDGSLRGGVVGETVAEILRAVVSTPGAVLVTILLFTLGVVIATPLRIRDIVNAVWGTTKNVSLWLYEGTVGILAQIGEWLAEKWETAAERLAARKENRALAREEAAPEEEITGDTERADILSIHSLGTPQRKETASLPGVSSEETEETEEKGGPVIVESRFRPADARELKKKAKQVDAQRLDYIPLGGGEYQLPPVNLLEYDDSLEEEIDRTSMLELSERLVHTLTNYGVKGEVSAIRPGPVVTMYEFAPAPGTRLSKIEGLADELAMNLEALRVRIVAPIPGKAVVGIEVPNRSREKVYLKEIVADDSFQSSSMTLPLALGKTIEGAPAVVDLAKMPHLLVAGTTGSGKSVSINLMITSLLYNCTPEDVRMIMVDPKMLELSIYEGVPHLLLPVVTEPKKANLALKWAVDEMERRYQLLSEVQARDIASYNRKVEKLSAKMAKERAQPPLPIEGTEEESVEPEAPKKLPYIVVVIDEFADLMMQAPKDVENSVARIAQKARAAGIHLILATQRPSTNVITGLIKANFPSRIAFHVVSKVDSRVVLDQGGAEALLGMGDMLFSDRGSAPCRFHGCFIDEEEVVRVVDFLKAQGRPVYNLDILQPRVEEGEGAYPGDNQPDEKYDLAVQIVAETRRATISYIQRRLGVGYNKAAKMIERMERDGIVSAPDNKKVREVLIPPAA